MFCFPHFDDPFGVVLHADLHMSNVWWDGSAASALIDFEFARLGPAWADLARICDAVDSDRAEGIVGRHQLLWQSAGRGLSGGVCRCRDLGDAHHSACRLAFELRQLLLWAPPSDPVPADHPQARTAGSAEQPMQPGHLAETGSVGPAERLGSAGSTSRTGSGIASSSSWV